VWDTTNATAGDRMRLYVNGGEVIAFSTDTSPSLNADSRWNSAVAHYQGSNAGAAVFDGYLSDVYFIDGQALTPSSFGETNSDGVWVPKAYTGTYGTNGFHLDFKDAALTAGSNAGLGKDVSGNGNYWTTNNISVTAGVTYDSMVDTPTNNYATLNPIDKYSTITVSDGALKAVKGTPDTWGLIRSTQGMDSGLYYWEVIPAVITARGGYSFGVYPNTGSLADYVGNSSGAGCQWATASTLNLYGTTKVAATCSVGADLTANSVIGMAYNANTGRLWIAIGNAWANSGDPSAGTGYTHTGITGTMFAAISAYYTSDEFRVNFGQRPFAYTPPTGFKALCTANFPAVAITKPANHFNAKTRTGTGAAFSVTGQAFQPDLVWTKGRSGATDHALYDAVRGVQKDIGTNLATDQTTQAQGVTAFNSDGFSGGTLAKINTNAATYIDWMWKESVTAGLDIVAVTGNGANRTVAHNLGVVPKMIIGKSLATAGADTGWPVYHASLANTEYLMLNTTAAKAAGATYWNSTTPTSSVFSLGTAADVNTNADTYIYYVFAEIPGYSKFGSYVGNGSADGPFVFCGFRPRFIMLKATTAIAGNWVIHDTARDAYNVTDDVLYPNLSNAEVTIAIDVTANGFKIRNNTTNENNTGSDTYIFAAFAEFPFGGSNVSPSPAR
jgi:hypothetical protein